VVSRTGLYLIVAALVALGLALALARHLQTGMPFLPGVSKPVWMVEARIDFQAQGTPITATFSLPDDTPGFRLYTEQAASPGYGFSVVPVDGRRRGEWTKREASGAQTLYYKAQFLPGDAQPVLSTQRPTARPVYWEEPNATAAKQLLVAATETSSDGESLARELLKRLNRGTPDQNAALLLDAGMGPAELLESLLNQANVPARIAMGLFLQDARRRQSLLPMVEVYGNRGWVLMNPRTGDIGVPDDLLLWLRGGESLLDVVGGYNSQVTFSMIRQTVPAEQLAATANSESVFARLGVQALPIEEQSMFKLLLLLPVGAIVVVFMRILVGIRTAGTFMPVLISLAFLQTSLLPGVLSFISIVAFGLLLRNYLSRLNLLMVARIATLVVLVIFIISAISLLSYQLGFSAGMTITFFPMIIIAWTIERMSILWEEEGPKEVMIQGGGSMVVAIIAYLLMELRTIQHLSFNFPELNFVSLAVILLLGQYTGYKLSELRRFRAMSNW